MRYELYGIGRDGGFVQNYGAFRSRKRALDAVDGVNSGVTPYFLVLEMLRKSAVPLGYYAGSVRDGYASLAAATYIGPEQAPGKHQIISPEYLKEKVLKKMRVL